MKPSPVRPKLAEGDKLTRIVLLVDYSNLLYRAYFSSIKDLEERPWLPIIRFIDSIRLCIQRIKVNNVPIEVIFAGESRKKLDRSKIDKSYKSQRIPVQHDVFRYFRQIMALLIADMGGTILSRDGAEADDVIASIAGYICHECTCKVPCRNCDHRNKYSTDLFIFSNDRDLNQLLRFERCYIYRSPGIFYTKENFIDEYKFHPSKFDIYKAMVGDKSDNISGINGFGPVKATNYILNNMIPVDEPNFINSLRLVSLDYDLDVPIEGKILQFDEGLSNSRFDISNAYGEKGRALMEIHLSFLMLKEIYA